MTQRTPFTCLSLTVYIVSCCGNNYSDLPTYPCHTHLWCTTHLNVEKNSYKEWENAATCRKYLVQLNSTSQHVACKRRGIFSYSLVPSRGMGKIRLHSLHLGCCFYCCKVKDMFMCVFCLLYHEKRKSKSGSGNGVHDRFVPPRTLLANICGEGQLFWHSSPSISQSCGIWDASGSVIFIFCLYFLLHFNWHLRCHLHSDFETVYCAKQ